MYKIFVNKTFIYSNVIIEKFITINSPWIPRIGETISTISIQGRIFAEIPTTFGEVKIGSMLFMFAFFIIGMQVFNSQELLNRLQRKVFWLPSILCCSIIPIRDLWVKLF